MKQGKSIFIVTVLFFVSVSGILAQNANQGIIRELSGTVEIRQPGSADWVIARQGQIIGKDSIISTSFKSSALISMGHTLITVRPLTRLTLGELAISAETEIINVNLGAGRVRVEVKAPSGTQAVMKVQSPIATASVRGTVFELDPYNLEVYEGTVEFSGSHGSDLLVDEGRMSYVDDITGRAVSPETAAAVELRPELPFGTDALPQNNDVAPNDSTILSITISW